MSATQDFAAPPARPQVALMLQGGGALGAYHIGAYAALAEADLHPDWIAGISMGAINGAIIAGNHPANRVARLAAFWEAISWPEMPGWLAPFVPRLLHDTASFSEALFLGQPGFFAPRLVNPWLRSHSAAQDASFYNTHPLVETLRQHADFRLINDGTTRLSLGATNLATGHLEFFDTHSKPIGPEHVLASGSLPPGFPATLVDGALYWDGGCVSNTPLDAVLNEPHGARTVVFLIDLFGASGPVPHNMSEVLWRAKEIQYASRTAHSVDAVATKVNLRHAMRQVQAASAPPNTTAAAGRLDIVHIIYHPETTIPNSDAEFSRRSIAERRAAGYRDMRTALAAEPWRRRELPAHVGALVHRVESQQVVTLPEPNLATTTDRPAAA